MLVFSQTLRGQDKQADIIVNSLPKKQERDSLGKKKLHLFSGKEQIDLLDIGNVLLSKSHDIRRDTSSVKTGKLHLSLLPSVEYTLQTSFAAALNGNAGFYTSNTENANISNILAVVKYTANNQVIIPVVANIWTKENKYNIITDWHFEKFPQETYGLGGFTTTAEGYQINYDYIRLYQTLLKTISTDFYIGLGYDFDFYWNIREINPPPGGDTTDFEKYGLTPKSISAGILLNILYDGRRNSINPQQGYYANLIIRPNFNFLGSDANWTSLILDIRKYQNFPSGSKNMLAFWSYDWLTLDGKPPYLTLPTTAGDTYNNLGRGYIQGRYRGKNLVYLESEYRFGITSNGLIGGVVFANAQSFTEENNNRFEVISPGWGAGIRIKLNKFSKTNVCLDYGFGTHGSRGLFANLGEVF
jgi:hypothetical protein